jgi:hypothetical protein
MPSLAFTTARLARAELRRRGSGRARRSEKLSFEIAGRYGVQPATRSGHPLEGFWLPRGFQGSHPPDWNECFAHQARDIPGLASGKLNDSAAETFADGYRAAEIVGTMEEAGRPQATVPVTFRT